MPRRSRRRSIDGMAAATDVYAFLALIGLLLLALARFHTPLAAEAAVGEALEADAAQLALVARGDEALLVGEEGRIFLPSCEGPAPDAPAITLAVPLDGSVSTELLSSAWACLEARRPTTPVLLTWN